MLARYSEASMEVEPEGAAFSPSDRSSRPVNATPPPDPGADGPAPLPVVRLRGVELHAITERQCIDHILRCLDQGVGGTVVTPNLDILRRCTKDLTFATLVSESDLVVADGMPLIWASRLQGTPLPERVAGSDLITSLSLAAAEHGRSIFLLGGAPGSAEGAAEILRRKAPNLKIAGMYCPPVGFEEKPEEMSRLIDALTQGQPDIVWVALGSPKQEVLINRIRQLLPGAWWLGVGISFSFLTGDVQRAPRWIQRIGMEWAHRMFQEPKRLFKRYLVHGLPFAAGLMFSALANRFAGASDEPTTGHRHRGRKSRKPGRKGNSPAGHPSLDESVAGMVLADAATGPQPNVPDAPTEPAPATPDAGLEIVAKNTDSALGKGLKRLKAIILLGGKVRQSPLSQMIGRSRLDLPLDENGTILNHWLAQSTELARRVGLEQLQVRVMVDQNSHAPSNIEAKYRNMVRVERDRSSYRGTGGLLADIGADYADDDLILVGNAHQVLLDPLWAIAAALDHKTGDFNLISHRDGTASGLMLLACKAVRSIAKAGYVDLKEQALPKIAKAHDVRVVHCRQPTGLPLFTLGDYISALQQHYRRRERRRARTNPLSEDFSRHFAIVEEGATVAPDAYLHDAIVLRGATVETGAAAIRSLICPGAILRRGRMVSDQLIGTVG